MLLCMARIRVPVSIQGIISYAILQPIKKETLLNAALRLLSQVISAEDLGSLKTFLALR